MRTFFGPKVNGTLYHQSAYVVKNVKLKASLADSEPTTSRSLERTIYSGFATSVTRLGRRSRHPFVHPPLIAVQCMAKFKCKQGHEWTVREIDNTDREAILKMCGVDILDEMDSGRLQTQQSNQALANLISTDVWLKPLSYLLANQLKERGMTGQRDQALGQPDRRREGGGVGRVPGFFPRAVDTAFPAVSRAEKARGRRNRPPSD